MVTLSPLASRRAPKEAAASPLPIEETTPPVTKINFVFTLKKPPETGSAEGWLIAVSEAPTLTTYEY
jgi:hypothetical protein